MEQLTGEAIEGLVRIARGGPVARGSVPALWKRPAAGDSCAGQAGAGQAGALQPQRGDAPLVGPPLVGPLIGIERRLVRRAEALWENLRGDAPMPDAAAAAILLGPPFSGCAMLLAMPAAAAPSFPAPSFPAPPFPASLFPSAPALPRVSFIGEALHALAIVHPGPVVPDGRPTAALGPRLAALAGEAVAAAAPVAFDSEGTPTRSAAAKDTPLLMRAIALPLAPAGDAGSTVVIILSWRELLSADETDALHRELAAAIGWMSSHKPQG